jgi:crotonobetainyl-CoA:carnitine CoA-transferase CaiB-like acyl-CoA transferase
MSVLAGLVQLEKHGEGCCVETPMFEGMVSFLMTEQLAGETFVPPIGGTGYERLNSPYRKPFATADGYISILPYNTHHWQKFFELVERPDMINHEVVTDPVKRSANVGSLYKIVNECTPAKSTAEWKAALTEIDVPFAPVNDIASLLHDPHLSSVNFFTEYQHPTEGKLRQPGKPFYIREGHSQKDIPPPALGYDTNTILIELGYEAEDISALQDSEIIFSH